jgi:hypothetical protein
MTSRHQADTEGSGPRTRKNAGKGGDPRHYVMASLAWEEKMYLEAHPRPTKTAA